jgi:iron complex outermembrane receptor protein
MNGDSFSALISGGTSCENMKNVLFQISCCAILLLVSCLVGVPAGQAGTAGQEDEAGFRNASADDEEENRLRQILVDHTEIATRTRLNADYVPGMVTVLYGDDLEARGVRTFIEALDLVPGMNIIMYRHGLWIVSVRGCSGSIAFGNVKFLIDDIPINTAFATDPVTNMPISQIERIDIIRGPGSAIYGEFAFSSVVNIITRKNQNRLFGDVGSFSTYGGGGIVSWTDPDENISLNLNMAGWRSDGADIISGPDTLYGRGMPEVSMAPGPTNETARYGSALLSFVYNSFRLNGQFLSTSEGDFFGLSYALPPADDEPVSFTDKYGIEATRQLRFSSSLKGLLRLGFQEQKFDTPDLHLFPPGYFIPLPNGNSIVFPDGWVVNMHYGERLVQGSFDLTWKGWTGHEILLGLGATTRKASDVWIATNFYQGPAMPRPIPMTRLDGSEIGFLGGRKREIYSVLFQDAWKPLPPLTLTYGMRYDAYNDIEDAFSPRLAAVYTLDDHQVLKAQYARAFRPPSFWEMYSANNPVGIGNPDLQSEINDTFELGYIYTDFTTTLRATIFTALLDNIVYMKDARNENSGYHRYWGIEMEAEHHFGDALKVDGNLSYLQSDDVETVSQGAQAPMWMANLGVHYQPVSSLELVAQYHFTGSRGREALDPRPRMDPSHVVDVTISWLHAMFRGLEVRAGIKNILNEDIRYPAPLEEFDPLGRRYPSYPEDFPRPGRTWWCSCTYTF